MPYYILVHIFGALKIHALKTLFIGGKRNMELVSDWMMILTYAKERWKS